VGSDDRPNAAARAISFGGFAADTEGVEAHPRSPRWLVRARRLLPHGRLAGAFAALLLAALVFELVEALAAPNLLGESQDLGLYLALIAGAGVLIAPRALGRGPQRGAWRAIGAGIACTVVAEIYVAAAYPDGEIPYPSFADALWLAGYPLIWCGTLLLIRRRVGALSAGVWLDGLIAVLATAAAATTFLMPALTQATAGTPREVAVNLAYPLGDLILIAVTVGGLALTGWRPDRALIALALANAAMFTADAVYLVQSANGTYVAGTWLDSFWPLGMLLFALAAWQPAGATPESAVGSRDLVLPVAFSALAVALLAAHLVSPVSAVGAGLALGAIVTMMLRFALTQKEKATLLAAAHRDALTDDLTGLGNRRALWLHLREATGPEMAVAILDLDGFKAYNDLLGHAAGDLLLVEVADRLDRAVPGGRAFRMGGDEFCLVGRIPPSALPAIATSIQDGLQGISVSIGAAWIPLDTDDRDEAMRLADQRMYAHKLARRAGTSAPAAPADGPGSVRTVARV
jgi:diguanylate cyclase (GGDEF)-like protein